MEKFEIGDFLEIKNTREIYIVKLLFNDQSNKLLKSNYFTHSGMLLYTTDETKHLYQAVHFNIDSSIKSRSVKKIENKNVIEKLTIKYNLHLLEKS